MSTMPDQCDVYQRVVKRAFRKVVKFAWTRPPHQLSSGDQAGSEAKAGVGTRYS
jgi:hypothetical protein